MACTVALATEVEGQSTMNNCPTRCAGVIRAKSLCAASAAAADVLADELGEADVLVEPEADGDPPALVELLAPLPTPVGCPLVVALHAASSATAVAAATPSAVRISR
jgi:hypothetical protein